MSEKPKFMTHERIMAGEEYVSYSDYLLLQRERDEAREDLEFRRGLYKVQEEYLKEARDVLREIAEASGFDNIGNWARNKAKSAIYR